MISRHCAELKACEAKDCNVALVVDGKTLKYSLSCDLRREFLELCLVCRVVVCCRVSPMQKAEVIYDFYIKRANNNLLQNLGGGFGYHSHQCSHLGHWRWSQ